MNILSKLTLRDLKLNKKRTIGTLVGIILATALITVVGGMFFTFQNTLVEDSIRNGGYYHIVLNNVANKDINEIKNNKDFKHIEIVKNLGSTVDPKDMNDYNSLLSMMDEDMDINNMDYGTIMNIANQRGIDITNLDEDSFMELMSSFSNYSFVSMNESTYNYLKNSVYKGTYPKNTDEVLVDNNYLRAHNLEIGAKISIEFIGGKTKEYKVVGVTSRYGEFVTAYDENVEDNNIYLTLKNPNNYKKAFSKLLGVEDYKKAVGSKYVFSTNKDILRWECGAFGDRALKLFYAVLGIVIGIILVTSVFSIRNSFAISVNEKIRTYGMLASIGATRKQIRRMVLLEGLYLGIIGIGFGIILGNIITYVLTLILNALASNANLVLDGTKFFYYKFSIIPTIISLLVGIVMIYLSTITSSIKASRVSPIQNIKNANDIKNPKKLRVPFYIKNIFKIGGILAYKNLKRSKKKYRVTVISLTVSIFVFIVVTSFLQYGIKTIRDEYININYDVSINNMTSMEEKVDPDKLMSLGDSHAVYIVKYDEAYGQLMIYDNKHVKDNSIINNMCSEFDESGTCIGTTDYMRSFTTIYDDATFKEYCKMIGEDYNKIKDKAIILDSVKVDKKYTRLTDYKKGDKLPYMISEEPNILFTYEVGAISNIKPWGLELEYSNDVRIILDAKYYKGKEELEVDEIYYETKDAKKLEDEIYKVSKELRINNISEVAKQLRTIILIFSIFIYGFIIVVTFIGITSVFNTINSNMELRRREFASLKSIGMTKKEFNDMILLESVFYSIKSLTLGIILGIIGSYFVYGMFKSTVDFGYLLPLKPIIISIVFIIALVYIIMKYSVNRINKENIIETIRKENI